ncbi:MAG: helix-turn-helix domain-containing protein [Candidatus Hodarchaeota archaeon]
MKHYLAMGEASVRLGVCVTTVRRWERKGKIHCYRTPGGHRRFAIVEIERIISGDLAEDLEGIEELGMTIPKFPAQRMALKSL